MFIWILETTMKKISAIFVCIFSVCSLGIFSSSYANSSFEELFKPKLSIFDFSLADKEVLRDGVSLISNINVSSPKSQETYLAFEKTLSFFKEKFDFEISETKYPRILVVNNCNTFELILSYAAWSSQNEFFILSSGGKNFSGVELNHPSASLDTIAHEFTHAIIHFTSKLTSEGQNGALNEHLADLFGMMTEAHYENDENIFLLGEDALAGDAANWYVAVRDMLNPNSEITMTSQFAHMDDIPAKYGPDCVPSPGNDMCGVHILNGILNRAVALAIDSLGIEKIDELFFTIMTEKIDSTTTLKDYRNIVIEECKIASLPDSTCITLESSFKEVGL